MSLIILFSAIVIFSCIITNKFSSKLCMPSLVFFMFLGILFGSDGVLKISFDDYDLTAKLCSIGLLFIIFYGGFCTKKICDNRVNLQAILAKNVKKKTENNDYEIAIAIACAIHQTQKAQEIITMENNNEKIIKKSEDKGALWAILFMIGMIAIMAILKHFIG